MSCEGNSLFVSCTYSAVFLMWTAGRNKQNTPNIRQSGGENYHVTTRCAYSSSGLKRSPCLHSTGLIFRYKKTAKPIACGYKQSAWLNIPNKMFYASLHIITILPVTCNESIVCPNFVGRYIAPKAPLLACYHCLCKYFINLGIFIFTFWIELSRIMTV